PSWHVAPGPGEVPSISGQWLNCRLRPLSVSGTWIGGETSRWSLIDEGSLAFHDVTGLLGREVERVQLSVPSVASWVQPLVPPSTSSSNSACVAGPTLHSPGPACVTKLKVALGAPPHALLAVTRHHSSVFSGNAALGWKLVVVTTCDR